MKPFTVRSRESSNAWGIQSAWGHLVYPGHSVEKEKKWKAQRLLLPRGTIVPPEDRVLKHHLATAKLYPDTASLPLVSLRELVRLV